MLLGHDMVYVFCLWRIQTFCPDDHLAQFVPYMLLVGLGFPIPFWLLHKKYPKFGFNYVFTPILVGKSEQKE